MTAGGILGALCFSAAFSFAQTRETPLFQERSVLEGSAFLPQCYNPALLKLVDGGLVCAWTSGSGRTALDLSIRLSVWSARSSTWTPATGVPAQPGYPDGYPLLTPSRNGGFRLFYATLYIDTLRAWSAGDLASWHLVYRDTADSGRTWGGKFFLLPESEWVPSARVVNLANGDLLLPVTNAATRNPGFLLSTDGGHYWTRTGDVPDSPEVAWPVVAQLSPGHLLAVLRPREEGQGPQVLFQSESHDNGRTWSRPQASGLPYRGNRVDLLRLRNGNLVMVHNGHSQWLTPLTVHLSEDGGKSWPVKQELLKGLWDQRDPSLVETEDGHIHVVYVYREIHLRHIEMNESWIRGAPQPSSILPEDAAKLLPREPPPTGEKPRYRAGLVFEPTLRFPRCHSSTITELSDGSLVAAWWNGSEEGARDVVIRASRRPAGKDQWEAPQIVSDTPDTTEGNPVVFAAPNHETWLFHRVGLNPWLRLVWFKSLDRGLTWRGPEVLQDQPGWALRSRIIQLRNGDIVIPTMTHTTSAFLISADGGRRWQRTAEIRTEPRNNEPTVFQRSDGSLLVFLRPYDPSPASRFLWQTESRDNGRTWSDPVRTKIGNPSAAVELLKLRSGRVALVFNNSQEKRTPLNLALSLDEGRTWPYMRVLEDGAGRFEYPTMTQAAGGSIHLTYTFRRMSIKHVELNEAWIMERMWED